jgi:hypothetical protein
MHNTAKITVKRQTARWGRERYMIILHLRL